MVGEQIQIFATPGFQSTFVFWDGAPFACADDPSCTFTVPAGQDPVFVIAEFQSFN